MQYNTTVITTEIVNGTTDKNRTGDTSNSDVFFVFMRYISVLILFGIIVCNMLVIVLLGRLRRKSRMGFFVTNLALADLAVGVFYVFPEIYFNWFENPWPKYFCYLYYAYFSMVAFYASTYSIVAITLDRLYMIIRPLASIARGRAYRYGLALSPWMLGLLLAIQYGVYAVYKNSQCGHNFPYKKGILYIDLFVLLIIPLAIITVCYVRMIIPIWKREKYGFVLPRHNTQTTGSSTNKVISSAKVKTIKLSFVVVIAYIASWMPLTVAAFLFYYNVLNFNNTIHLQTYYALFVFAPVNSLVNPLVFLIFNRTMFRKKTIQRSSSSQRDSEYFHTTIRK